MLPTTKIAFGTRKTPKIPKGIKAYFLFLLKTPIPQNRIPVPAADKKKKSPIPIGEPQCKMYAIYSMAFIIAKMNN